MSTCRDCHSPFCLGDCVNTEERLQGEVEQLKSDLAVIQNAVGEIKPELIAKAFENLEMDNGHLRDENLMLRGRIPAHLGPQKILAMRDALIKIVRVTEAGPYIPDRFEMANQLARDGLGLGAEE